MKTLKLIALAGVLVIGVGCATGRAGKNLPVFTNPAQADPQPARVVASVPIYVGTNAAPVASVTPAVVFTYSQSSWPVNANVAPLPLEQWPGYAQPVAQYQAPPQDEAYNPATYENRLLQRRLESERLRQQIRYTRYPYGYYGGYGYGNGYYGYGGNGYYGGGYGNGYYGAYSYSVPLYYSSEFSLTFGAPLWRIGHHHHHHHR